MESTRLIKNTGLEQLMLRYKREQNSQSLVVIDRNMKDLIIKQMIESFDFLRTLGKPNHATMSADEFKVAQQEIKRRANAELERLKDSLRIFGFLAFIPRWLLRKKISAYKFRIDCGYSQTLLHSASFEGYRGTAQTYRISRLPVNFEELTEQLSQQDAC